MYPLQHICAISASEYRKDAGSNEAEVPYTVRLLMSSADERWPEARMSVLPLLYCLQCSARSRVRESGKETVNTDHCLVDEYCTRIKLKTEAMHVRR